MTASTAAAGSTDYGQHQLWAAPNFVQHQLENEKYK